MLRDHKEFHTECLGECRIDTPIVNARFINEDDHVLDQYQIKKIQPYFQA